MKKYSVLMLLAVASPLWAQTVTPAVGAGTLLEQQRRLNPPIPLQSTESGVVPSVLLPGEEVPRLFSSDTGAQTTVLRFDVQGNTLIEPEVAQLTLAPWIGHPVSLADLRQATSTLESLYRQRGWLARVSLPGQDITDGTVRFNVNESRLGRIVLRSSDSPIGVDLTARIQALLVQHLPTGKPLDLSALERALLLADAFTFLGERPSLREWFGIAMVAGVRAASLGSNRLFEGRRRGACPRL